MEGVPVDQQRIVFSGVQLMDGNTLNTYGIKVSSNYDNFPLLHASVMFVAVVVMIMWP